MTMGQFVMLGRCERHGYMVERCCALWVGIPNRRYFQEAVDWTRLAVERVVGPDPDPLTVASDPAEPLPTWPRHDPATGVGLALIAGAVVVACLVAWGWRRG